MQSYGRIGWRIEGTEQYREYTSRPTESTNLDTSVLPETQKLTKELAKDGTRTPASM